VQQLLGQPDDVVVHRHDVLWHDVRPRVLAFQGAGQRQASRTRR